MGAAFGGQSDHTGADLERYAAVTMRMRVNVP